MGKRLNSLKYFAPLVQIALCPVTILFLWTVFTGPEAIPVVSEELVNQRHDGYMNEGIVYVLTNPAMPGMVKIGRTDRRIGARLSDLCTIGLLLTFECEYAA